MFTRDISSKLVGRGYRKEDVALANDIVTRSILVARLTHDAVIDCTQCNLCKECKRSTPGFGNITSPLMIIGEGPGAEEEETGVPFVGESGQVLTMILAKAGIKRDSVYLTNVVKCRPLGNRTPSSDEANFCGYTHLDDEIRLIQPKVILTVGSVAMKYVRKQSKLSITKERGNWVDIDYNGIIIPTLHSFHPSYLLYSEGQELIERKRLLWNDIQMIVTKLKEIQADNYVLS
jgi:uracil-DNA glycosylase family 4